MRQHQNPFNVGPGDIVKLVFTHRRDPAERNVTARIMQVKTRYGAYDGGHAADALIEYVNLETGEQSSSAASWITEVVQRNPLPQPVVNPFSEASRRPAYRPRRVNRSTIQGSLTELVIYYLSKLPYRFSQSQVDAGRIRELFNKQTPGLIDRIPRTDIVTVHEKPFQQWVRQNAYRLLATVAQLNADETEYHQEMAKQYYDDWAADMDAELMEEYGRVDQDEEPMSDSMAVLMTVDPSWGDF